MPKQLPFKKEYLLAGAATILLLLSYQLAFKKTIAAWQLNHRLKQELATSADISSEPQYQERKNNNLGQVIGLYRADTLEFRSNMIGEITKIAEKENVKLTAVPSRDPLFHSSKFLIQKLDLEGDYFSLTKVFDLLNKARGIGVIRSSTYKSATIMAVSSGEKKVTLELYIIIVNE
jgi:hypothetical protein